MLAELIDWLNSHTKLWNVYLGGGLSVALPSFSHLSGRYSSGRSKYSSCRHIVWLLNATKVCRQKWQNVQFFIIIFILETLLSLKLKRKHKWEQHTTKRVMYIIPIHEFTVESNIKIWPVVSDSKLLLHKSKRKIIVRDLLLDKLAGLIGST